MIIPLNIQATVKCSDGICYPCMVMSTITNDNLLSDDYLPKYGIRFTGLRPENVIHREMIVNMGRVYFGGNDEQ